MLCCRHWGQEQVEPPAGQGYLVNVRRTLLIPLCSAACALASLFGCGDSASSHLETSNSAVVAGPIGVEISGNLAGAGGGSILVFAFAGLPKGQDPSQAEPLSVGSVGPDGEFLISNPAGEMLTVVFLSDAANDGVIDPGDPVAVLMDPNHQLTDLRDGDRINLSDVQLAFATRRAIAASIEVARAPAVPPTPTPNTDAG